MAKNSAKAPDRGAANARAAKIQAAQKSAGGGANKIVVATVVAIVAIIATVGGVVWSQTSKENAPAAGGNALPTGVSELGKGHPAFQDVTAADGAPTVDLYVDYQCPACAMFEKAFGPTLSEQASSGKIKLVYHVKNFLDDNLKNDSSTRGSQVANSWRRARSGILEKFTTTCGSLKAPHWVSSRERPKALETGTANS